MNNCFKIKLTSILFSAILLVTSCKEPNRSTTTFNANRSVQPSESSSADIAQSKPDIKITNDIRSIFQDSNNNYWFGTNSSGVFRYDGKTLTQFNRKDGLSFSQVLNIQQDTSGNIWFATEGFGVSSFNGQAFTTYTNTTSACETGKWKMQNDDLWFYAGSGVYHYTNSSFSYLPFPVAKLHGVDSKNSFSQLGPYSVYCCLKDRSGKLWIGTQSMGVCRYDGENFTWFTQNGLAGPAVLGMFQDKNGNMWFGNNGSGLFCYDGKTLTNFTEQKGLGNPEFRRSGKSGLGTLARVYSINQDNNGDIWIGTVDAGVWRYNGTTLTNYTTKNGLTGNAINTIYKDKKGELWFGTDADGIFKFNGTFFEKFETI